MYNINALPVFTYAGALMPKRDASKANLRDIALAICAGLLLAGLMI